MDSQFKKGVSLIGNYKNDISYRCNCTCGDNEHDVIIDFEVDEEYKMITLNFYKNLSFSHYWIYRDTLWFDKLKVMSKKENLLKCISYFFKQTIGYYSRCWWCRLKATIRIICTGYIKVESDFILAGEQLDNFIFALQEGRDTLKESIAE